MVNTANLISREDVGYDRLTPPQKDWSRACSSQVLKIRASKAPRIQTEPEAAFPARDAPVALSGGVCQIGILGHMFPRHLRTSHGATPSIPAKLIKTGVFGANGLTICQQHVERSSDSRA